MVEHARRLHPGLRFEVASATELQLSDASLGGVLGWWSLFNLPRDVLPAVLASFARALVPGGQVLLGTHVGDGEIVRTEAYGGVPVAWTTHLWQPEELTALLGEAGLDPVAELRLPPPGPEQRHQVVLAARRPGSRASGLASAPVVAASDREDPGDDQQHRKDQAPHEPAVHRSPLSVVCEHDAAPDAAARDRQPAPDLRARRHP